MTATILTIIGGLLGGGLIGAVLMHIRDKPKADAEADATASKAALEVLKDIREIYKETADKLAASVDYNQELRDHIYEQKPPPPPPWPSILKER